MSKAVETEHKRNSLIIFHIVINMNTKVLKNFKCNFASYSIAVTNKGYVLAKFYLQVVFDNSYFIILDNKVQITSH